MATMDLLIVEPFFTAIGHPAQSVLNTARVLGKHERISYLISQDGLRPELASFVMELGQLGRVYQFHVPRASLAVGTLFSLLPLIRIARQRRNALDVFFLDAHLPALALLWPILRVIAGIHSLSALELNGPESHASRWWSRWLVRHLLHSRRARVFLRTEELAVAWRQTFAARGDLRIDTLPSLEIPETEESVASDLREGPCRFGVIGQIRSGKGLEWLVPLFLAQPTIGELRIVGRFYNQECRAQLPMVATYFGFRDEFVAEPELVPLVASFDYLLTLYDNWDSRLEAATFFLAARAERPIICYDEGWCGRMVTEFGCGIAVAREPHPDPGFFAGLPAREAPGYAELVAGMKRFKAAHSGRHLRAEFIRKLISDGQHGFFGELQTPR